MVTEPVYYIGLMSGTSMDGIDSVLVDLEQTPPKLHASYSHSFPKDLQQSLSEVIKPEWKGSLAEIGELHQCIGESFAEAANQLIRSTKIPKRRIQAIGSHGQTAWHQPEGKHPFSLQLGDGNLIAERTGITTVADFRNRDIAAGGQGAPLVPAFHLDVLRHSDKNRVILNIGGLSNISFLPAGNNNHEPYGFDTGPGNCLMDSWISQQKQQAYDKSGDWAKSGNVLPDVLKKLLSDPYFSLAPPKSTGKELFNIYWLENHLHKSSTYKSEDIQATLAELSAKTIAKSLLQTNTKVDEMYVCGGGVHNEFLMKRLRHHLSGISISSTNAVGIDPDWMEAIAFAWLAKRTLEGKASNLPSATGAKGFRVLGAIYN